MKLVLAAWFLFVGALLVVTRCQRGPETASARPVTVVRLVRRTVPAFYISGLGLRPPFGESDPYHVLLARRDR